MTIDDVKFIIKNYIISSISHRDLCTLCNVFNIPISTRRKQNQQNLLDSIIASTNLTLLHSILYMINKSNIRDGNLPCDADPPMPELQRLQPNVQNLSQTLNRLNSNNNNSNTTNSYSLNLKLYCLSNDLIDQSPINVRPELVSGVNPLNIFVPNFTKYPSGYFNAPSCSPFLLNGRMNSPTTQLPYISKNMTIKASPFYCCQVVLHPVSLLIPKPMPNICQPNRIMSKMQLNFTLSCSVRQLITTYHSITNNRHCYKWQVLLRFGVYDPIKPFPSYDEDIGTLQEYIPPYLSLSVNNMQVPMWEILPSNSIAKEGKRHSRPVNITEYIKYSLVDTQGYKQIINVNWWQTPGVFLYYYIGVFLERKLDVRELLNQFVNKTHSVQRPMSFTLDFIREKFSSNSQFSRRTDGDNDDDLIISSVLPVSLQCPVGKSRITCPLRSIHCQHLQAFDAHLYLMMNERRSVWKCPVCDGQATLSELFVDEYFQQILRDFEEDEDVSEVNVNPDGTYVPVAAKESREGKQHLGNIISNVKNPPECQKNNDCAANGGEEDTETVISLESDEEDQAPAMKVKDENAQPSEMTEAISRIQPERSSLTIDLTSDSEEDNRQNPLAGPPKPLTVHPQPPLSSSLSISAPLHSPPLLPLQNLSPSQSARLSFPRLLPRQQLNLPEQIPTPSLNNSSLSRLITSASNTVKSGMSWMPPQQYTCIFPKSVCMPTNSTFYGSGQRPPNNPNPPNPINHRLPAPSFYNTPDHPYIIPKPPSVVKPNTNGARSGASPHIGRRQKKTTKETKRKVRRRLRPESQDARRSSRIQRQYHKRYIESSTSTSNEEDFDAEDLFFENHRKVKRDNIFDDSGSSSSSFSNRKRKRPVLMDSSDESESGTAGVAAAPSSSSLPHHGPMKVPVVRLTRLDAATLQEHSLGEDGDGRSLIGGQGPL